MSEDRKPRPSGRGAVTRRVNELESRVLALEAMLEEIGAALAAHDAVLEFSDEEANDNAAPSAH